MFTTPASNSEQINMHTLEPKAPSITSKNDLTKENSKDGQLSDIDCTSDFSFEKARIKAIEHTQLFASLNTGNVSQDSMLKTSKTAEIFYNSTKNIDDLLTIARQSKVRIINIIQTIGTILSLFAILNFISVLFAMLFLSVSNMPLTKYLFLFIIEIVFTSIFFAISLKSSTAEKFSFKELNIYFRLVIVYAILLFSIMIILMLHQSLNEAFKSAASWHSSNTFEDKVEAMYSITLISIFFSCTYKLIISILNIVFCVLLKRTMTRISSLEEIIINNKSFKLPM